MGGGGERGGEAGITNYKDIIPIFSCFVLFVVLLLRLEDRIPSDNVLTSMGESLKGAVYFAFLSFVTSVITEFVGTSIW